jgi:hypothetical protein
LNFNKGIRYWFNEGDFEYKQLVSSIEIFKNVKVFVFTHIYILNFNL